MADGVFHFCFVSAMFYEVPFGGCTVTLVCSVLILSKVE
jgi:hypothetical protein